MDYHVGQRVVCIGCEGTPGVDFDAWFAHFKIVRPTRGLIYTVRETRFVETKQIIRVVEIVNPVAEFRDAPPQEPWWPAKGFRPVVQRKTDISIFKAMLNPSPVTVDAMTIADTARESMQ